MTTSEGMGVLFIFAIGLVAFAFWLWMLIDCLRNEPDGSSKIAWLLVILLAGAVGAPLYFFVRKLGRSTRSNPPALPPLHQPWNKNQPLG